MSRGRPRFAAGIAVYLALLLIAAAVFQFSSGLDLQVSALFYAPGHGFFLDTWAPVALLVRAIPWIVGLIVVIVVVAAVWLAWRGRPLWRLNRTALVFIVLSTALGPGLLVNTVLKDHWGRARPVQIALFGGVHHFTPALVPSDQCPHNCSFVSGHAALAFSLVAFALLLPRGRLRVLAQAAALAFGILVGIARIAQGGHFLSDIVFAGLLVYATSWLLYEGIVARDGLGRPLDWLGRGLAARPVIVVWMAALALVEALLMRFVDRPLALYLHTNAVSVHPLFVWLTEYGVGYPYLIVSGVAYAVLRWGGAVPALRPYTLARRHHAWVPGFLFAAMAASGLIADLIKVFCGRTRPKLLFAAGAYHFTGFATRADHWSFPSGHATTIVALMTALWCLWPRYVALYVLVATVVAGSRVVIGQHYLSDVVMGAAIAIAATLVIYRLLVANGVDLAVTGRPGAGGVVRLSGEGRRV